MLTFAKTRRKAGWKNRRNTIFSLDVSGSICYHSHNLIDKPMTWRSNLQRTHSKPGMMEARTEAGWQMDHGGNGERTCPCSLTVSSREEQRM